MASPASTPLAVDAPAQHARRWRPEIQALRAFAVVAVILYHAWPARMPGGYIGVDVFFVVSGYLILGQLGHRLITTGRLDLADFWARRMRRLAPAALLVLVGTAVAVMIVVPLSLQGDQLAQLAASAVALGNWALLAQEADYLQAGQAVAPGQHFWSLSIEEQLYVAAPLLLLAAVVAVTAVARRRAQPGERRELRLRRGVVLSIVVGALALSLALSTHAVATGQPDAFLGTGGRVWEFAAGGVLALLSRRGPGSVGDPAPRDGRAEHAGRARSAARWIGWILLGASTLLYGPETPFPGAGAIPVVVGTLLIIATGTPAKPRGLAWLAARSPVQWVGGVSYAAYLWHWPLIVLLPWVTLHPLTALEKAAIVAATLVLAWLSTRWIENPVRFGAASRAPSLRVIGVGALASLLVAGALWGGAQSAQARVADAADAAEVTRGIGFPPSHDPAAPDPSAGDLPTPAECFGAPALTNPACDGVLEATGFTPAVEAASGDRAIIYSSDCRTSLDSDEVLDCAFGPVDGRPVVLVGDSHSAVWFPALEPIAEREGWRLTVYFRGACAFTTADRGSGQNRARTEACLRWVDGVSARLAENDAPDLVFTAASTGATYRDADGAASAEAGVDGFVDAWRPLVDRGSQLVVLAEPPLLGDDGERCQLSRPDDPLPCSPSRASALDFRDLAVEAGRQLDAVILDLRDEFCTPTECPTVIGGALVYRDADHFTATFGATLTAAVDARLRAAGLLQ
ncbi:acyltransferase family protein [Microcella indica]|uniref:acyltransferase family protein n=1 Tax=Microcella indica TaxID=2750620 RepID=UPI0015CF42E9|nr:acyltransferase family protein [Microcella indica]